MKTNEDWISVHLFYHDNLLPVLTRCVYPLIMELNEKQTIRKFFFIRYWLGGPHIRLRILPNPSSDVLLIKQHITLAVETFFRIHPSTKILDLQQYSHFCEYHSRAEYGEDVRIPLYEDNSLHYISYEPEYGHYGGYAAMDYVQSHFMESSSIVLDLLTGGATPTQCMMLGTAATLLIALLEKHTDQDLHALFEEHFLLWDRIQPQKQAQALKLFQHNYQRQHNEVARLVNTLLFFVKSDVSHPHKVGSSLHRWYLSIHELYQSLRTMEIAEQLHGLFFHTQASKSLSILLRCLHMHNNRMGVPIAHESYQLYVLRSHFAQFLALQEKRV